VSAEGLTISVSVSDTIVRVRVMLDEPPGPLTVSFTENVRVDAVVLAKLRTTGVPVAVVTPGLAIESKSQDQLVIDPVDVLVNVMFVAS
jgi:hypothetical protein